MAEGKTEGESKTKGQSSTPSSTPSSPSPIPTPAPQKKANTSFADVFAFSGPGPERINGRLAMIGFVAALAVELYKGTDLLSQISDGGAQWFLGTSILLSIASLVPLFRGESPESKTEGLMNSNAELWNGSLDQVYQIVLQEEKQRSLSASVSINGNSTAFHSYISGDYFKNGQAQQRSNNQGFSRPGSAPYSGLQSQSSQFNSSNYKTGQKAYSDKNFPDKKPYFCDHCKIPGHSTQRCFKLHGYPPKHRLYRGKVAAVAQTEIDSDAQPSQSHALTTEQYNQLIQLLQHHNSDMDKPNENGSIAGFFAGPHHTEGNPPW